MSDPCCTYVMTGGSAGLGRAAARLLLTEHPDMHLVLLARGQAAQTLPAALAAATGNSRVTSVRCDLASSESLHDASGAVVRDLDAGRLPPLRGFLGNGGVLLASRDTATVDGYETTFAVNVLSHALLLDVLADRVRPGGRIVLTSSGSHWGDRRHNLFQPPPVWDDVEQLATPGGGPDLPGSTKAGGRAYSTSKLAVLYLVHALARRRPDVDAYAFNPDLVTGTGLVGDHSRWARAAFASMTPLFRATGYSLSPAAAGRLLADVAAGPRPGPSGTYIERHGPTPSSADSYHRAREDDLWSAAARLNAARSAS